MTTRRSFRALRAVALVPVAVALALGLAACGQAASYDTGVQSPSSSGASQAKGTAQVAYAGSLDKLYNTVLGPAFAKATGYSFGGPPGAGSLALAQQILSGEISPGVFMSVGAKAIKKLWPTRATFSLELATDPLVLAYSPKSRYAARLDAFRTGKAPLAALFGLLETPGFRLGRSDPNQDPQGQFFELMVELATRVLHLPSDTATRILGTTPSDSIGNRAQIFAETALPTMIAAGSVDAGSAYLPQALQYHLDYITLPRSLNFAVASEASLYATVSLRLADGTVVNGEPITLDAALIGRGSGPPPSAGDAAAATAFVAWLLSDQGRLLLRQHGYSLGRPSLHLAPGTTGAASVLPPSVLAAFDKLGGSTPAS